MKLGSFPHPRARSVSQHCADHPGAYRRARLFNGSLATLGITALLAATPGLTALESVAQAADVSGPIVTEIQGDNTGFDNFEYIELYNPTTETIDFAAEGVTLGYDLGSSVKPLTTAAVDGGTGAPNIVIASGKTVVLWLSYNDGKNVDSFAKTEQEFRDAIGMSDSSVPVVRVTGQAGIANGGDRGIVVQRNGETISESHLPKLETQAPGK